ncbi:MAG: choice-of-anchor Q domain-containing protein [Verrucomicrobiota bacterium]
MFVLLGLLPGPAFAGTWTVQPWNGDASSGIVSGETRWAYHFGSATTGTVNGVSVPGFAALPVNVANQMELTGPEFVITSDTNNLTSLGGSASAVMGGSFLYGGLPSTNLTVKAAALVNGGQYVVSFFSVGWDGPTDPRLIKFVSGADEMAIDQNLYGENFGLRADYAFTAGAGDQALRVDMNNAFNRTFHIYAVALRKVAIHTNVALGSNNNPSLPGSAVTFTATVTPVSGGGTPTGSLVFKDGNTTLNNATLNASGVATFTTSALSEGSHSITATYGGSTSYFDKVSSPLTQVVSKMNTTTALISSANPALPAASVAFTATVSPISGGGIPTGNVVFKDGAATLGTGTLNGSGVATYTTSALNAGIHSITASYGGSSFYNSSVSAPLNQAIAGTYTVTTTASAGGGSLAQTITDATPGSFVVFQASLAGKVLTMPAGEIILDKDLTIDASALAGGVILQGEGVNRLLYIQTGRTVIFKNLTLAGGGGTGAANTDRGGAVLNAGTLVAEDCVFTGSKGAFGGAIATGYSSASTSLTLRRCWIFDNAATGSGGGIILTANTASLTATLQMEECTVESNRAGSAGGGLYSQGASADSTITTSLRQCTFRGNTAAADGGGGIFSRASSTAGTSAASLTLVHCTVTDNTGRYGGGVATATDYGCPTSLTLTGNIIAGNHSPSAVDVGRQGGTFTTGGGNLIGSTTLSHITTWAASDLTGTDAAPLDAGVAPLGFYGGPVPTCPLLPGSPALDAATAIPPTATDQRGLPRVQDADGTGGAVADIGAVESVFARVDVANDELDTPAGADDVSIREALRDAPSGAIITFAPGLSGQSMTLNESLGRLNITKAVCLDASSLPAAFTVNCAGTVHRLFEVFSGTTLHLRNLRLTGSAATFPDGASAINNSAGTVSLDSCTISGHKTDGSGAIFMFGGRLYISRCTFASNTTTGIGGAICMFGGSLTMRDSTLTGNGQALAGGALCMQGGFASLSRCTLENNTSTNGGGAILAAEGASLNLSHCTLTRNQCPNNNGGGLFASAGGPLNFLRLDNTIVAGNSAATGPDIFRGNSTLIGIGGNLIGKNNGAETAFLAGTPNPTGHYVGTTDAPLDALLGPLANNGGPTQTCLPLPGSPAIDHATAALSHLTDARGFPRNKDGDGDFTFLPDIGATEFGTDPVLVVNTLADELDTPTAGASLSLREALRQAPAGAIITFAPALNGKTLVMDAAKGYFTLDRSVTVDASGLPAGLVLDAGTGDNRHIIIPTGAHVAFSRITFTSGGSGTGTAELGKGLGGAIYLVYGNLVLTDCTLRDNTATFSGGAIMQVTDTCRLVMSRCTLHRNQVLPSGTSSRTGGALTAFAGLVDLDHCTFTANQAPTYGGAAYFLNAQVEVNHCTITGNALTGTALGGSGFLFFNGPPDRVRVSNSIFCGNSGLLDLYVDDGTFLSGGGNVGGIVQPAFNQPTDVNNITDPFQLGLAELGRYGGVTDTMPPMPGSQALDRAASSTATADQRGFARNFDGDFNGSAVSDSGAAESFIVRANEFSDQFHTPSGSAVSLREAIRDAPAGAVVTTTVNGSLVSQVEVVLDKPLILAGNAATWSISASSARAFYVAPGAQVHMHRISIPGNGPSSGGTGKGAVASGKGGAILNQGVLSMTNCSLEFGKADYGGAIANGMAATPSTLVMRRCNLGANSATTYGGALYNASASGGAATVTLENCRIYSNTSGRHGGALVNTAGNGPAGMTLLHCTLVGNSAVTSGGGLYTFSTGTSATAVTTTLTSSIIAGNTAPQGPDVQLNSGAVASLTNLIGVADSGGGRPADRRHQSHRHPGRAAVSRPFVLPTACQLSAASSRQPRH